MKVKPTNSPTAHGLVDPDTRRSPFVDSEGRVLDVADVPDTAFWRRRLIAREIEILESNEPTGLEPMTPLTTRRK